MKKSFKNRLFVNPSVYGFVYGKTREAEFLSLDSDYAIHFKDSGAIVIVGEKRACEISQRIQNG